MPKNSLLSKVSKPLLLLVDDTPLNLAMLVEALQDKYQLRVAKNGQRAIEVAHSAPRPDLILLDINMPGMDGYEVLGALKRSEVTADIPVIFLTALSAANDEQRGLQLGAVDYVTKPYNPPILQLRIRAQLELARARRLLSDRASFLEAEVERRTAEIQALQDVVVHAMASLAEARDNETGNHILRTKTYVRRLAESLREHPRFSALFTAPYIELLYKSAPLHDIGKVAIPDAILLKPDRLTPEEFEVMKTHTTLGYEAIIRAEEALAQKLDFLHCAKEIALSHQEKWDGSGYPEGLSGDAIPASARLMALADVYDALISERVYKPAFSHETAVEIIRDGRGSHFDPDICDAFLEIHEEFREIASRYAD